MNKLEGIVQQVLSSESLSLVTVTAGVDSFYAVILEGTRQGVSYFPGEEVYLIFKETEVGLAKALSGRISFRNRFKGVIRSIERGTILTKVIISYGKHSITALITTCSSQEMALRAGETIEWLIKTNEVSLMKKEAHV